LVSTLQSQDRSQVPNDNRGAHKQLSTRLSFAKGGVQKCMILEKAMSFANYGSDSVSVISDSSSASPSLSLTITASPTSKPNNNPSVPGGVASVVVIVVVAIIAVVLLLLKKRS
jgi:hypothetical protein